MITTNPPVGHLKLWVSKESPVDSRLGIIVICPEAMHFFGLNFCGGVRSDKVFVHDRDSGWCLFWLDYVSRNVGTLIVFLRKLTPVLVHNLFFIFFGVVK